MIRKALFVDQLRILELIAELHAKSRYAGIELNDQLCKRYLIEFIRLNQAWVAEHDGRVVGVLVVYSDWIYGVLKAKMAADQFFYVSPDGGGIADWSGLIDAFVAWFEQQPRVIEVSLSSSGAVEGWERVEALYRRKGFAPYGAVFRKGVG